MRRRVVITGLGAISGAGPNASALRDALREGRRTFSEIRRTVHTPGARATHAGLVTEIPLSSSDLQTLTGMDRVVHLALHAAREAVSDAGIAQPLGPGSALVLGTCSGGMVSAEQQAEGGFPGRTTLMAEALFSKRYYTPAKVIAWATGISGPVITVVTACAAGAGAIAQGADLIRAGLSDLVLAGGADSFALSTLAGFDALKATCEGLCTPFSKNVGLNLGEGAAFLVLEEIHHALRRNGTVLAEVLGSGLSNDAYHATSPDPTAKGQMLAMERTLSDAGADPTIIEYVNAHGTGTRANDPIESRSIGRLLGDRANRVPVSSTKSMLGHCLGAAGVLESTATILSLRSGFLPPTAGFTEPREGCGLGDFVSDVGRPSSFRIALSNSFGFGGNNGCLLLDVKPDEREPATALPSSRTDNPVITGHGVVHALGLGLQSLMGTEETGIRPAEALSEFASGAVAGLVPAIDPREVDRRLNLKGMDGCSRYAVLASRLAVQMAGIPLRPAHAAEIGMVLGLSTGPTQGESRHLQSFFEGGPNLSRVDAFPYVVQNEVAGHVARSLMLKGHNTVISQGWGAGLAALISSAIAVTEGHAATVIAAASDELTPQAYRDGFLAGQYGPAIGGMTPGEGAAALVVENVAQASAKRRPALAEILGVAMATDVSDRYWVTSGGAVEAALKIALCRAGICGEDVQHAATGQNGSSVDPLEGGAVASLLPNAAPLSLSGRLGTPEAALVLINLVYLLHRADPGAIIACTALSREGLASAALIRKIQ